jgi:hypothetical protein
MHEALFSLLRPVRRRQRWQGVLAAASLGLLLGSATVCLLRLSGWFVPSPVFRYVAIGLLVTPPLAGAGLAGLAGTDWGSAARAVDRAYGLKDLTASALDFAARSAVTHFEELTEEDALRHLERVQARTAVPLRLPRSAPWAVAALALAVFLLQHGPASAPAADLTGPPQAILDEADLIEGYAREVEKMAEEVQSPELKKLAAEMKKKAEEMRQPGVDVREALARISEMQQALSQLKAELNGPLVDAQLKELGSALRESPPLEQAGKALQESQLDRAARLLEALAKEEKPAAKPKDPRPDGKDARANHAAGETTARVAKEMAAKKLDKLGKAADKLAKGLQGDDKQMKQGAKDLADEVRQQERRKRINELLAREDRRLQDCKSRCEKQNLLAKPSQSGSGKSPPQPQTAEKPSEDKGSTEPSVDRSGPARERGKSRPSESGKTSGQASNERKDKPGSEAGEPSDSEAGEAQGDRSPRMARRLSPEAYRKLQRQSEAVIEDEAIPLGLREAIRKYFELLRPSANEEAPAPK